MVLSGGAVVVDPLIFLCCCFCRCVAANVVDVPGVVAVVAVAIAVCFFLQQWW